MDQSQRRVSNSVRRRLASRCRIVRLLPSSAHLLCPRSDVLQRGPELLRPGSQLLCPGSLPSGSDLRCPGCDLPCGSDLQRSGHLLPGRLLRRSLLLPAQEEVLPRALLLEALALRTTEKPLDHGPHGHGLVRPQNPGHPLAETKNQNSRDASPHPGCFFHLTKDESPETGLGKFLARYFSQLNATIQTIAAATSANPILGNVGKNWANKPDTNAAPP